MSNVTATVKAIVEASSWNHRVNLIRRIPEHYGRGQLRGVYAILAQDLYVSKLTPDFAYVHWRDEYELSTVESAYQHAYRLTEGFTAVTADDLRHVFRSEPNSLLIFRLLIGFTTKELAVATQIVAAELDLDAVTDTRIKAIEAGRAPGDSSSRVLAESITRGIADMLFPPPARGLRSKQDRPDLVGGWAQIREYASSGVPLPVFLHQRHYGGSFRQLLDATSMQRGDMLEDAVEELLADAGVPFIRTGSHNQAAIAERFNLTVQPAPDFVLYDQNQSLQGMLECKAANDGGTARDKAARYASLNEEGKRLGGVPVFAVLGGLGWTRTSDALGPVIQACDGRVFTLMTLREMLTVDPTPRLIGSSRP